MAQHSIHSDDMMRFLSRTITMPIISFPPFVIPDHRNKIAYGRRGEVYTWRHRLATAHTDDMAQMLADIERNAS